MGFILHEMYEGQEVNTSWSIVLQTEGKGLPLSSNQSMDRFFRLLIRRLSLYGPWLKWYATNPLVIQNMDTVLFNVVVSSGYTWMFCSLFGLFVALNVFSGFLLLEFLQDLETLFFYRANGQWHSQVYFPTAQSELYNVQIIYINLNTNHPA